MAIVISVLTPDWLLQVSDAPEGETRSVKLERRGAHGLLGWAGPMDALDGILAALGQRSASDPTDLADQIRLEASSRIPDGDYATALLAGWGTSPEGHRASWRWRVTNFEDEDTADDNTFTVDGTWLVQSYARPGGQGKRKAKRSFSVQISATRALDDSIMRRLDKLPRELKKDPAPNELALELSALIAQVEGDGPKLLALLRPDGSLEGGVLSEGGLAPVNAPSGDGLWRLEAVNASTAE